MSKNKDTWEYKARKAFAAQCRLIKKNRALESEIKSLKERTDYREPYSKLIDFIIAKYPNLLAEQLK